MYFSFFPRFHNTLDEINERVWRGERREDGHRRRKRRKIGAIVDAATTPPPTPCEDAEEDDDEDADEDQNRDPESIKSLINTLLKRKNIPYVHTLRCLQYDPLLRIVVIIIIIIAAGEHRRIEGRHRR